MSMTIEQAKSELMQIYGALSPDKQRAIDTLVKIEPCEDAISRQDVWFKLTNGAYDGETTEQFIDRIAKEIESMPPVNPQEPKIGHWAHDGSYWKYRFICSECNYRLLDKLTNYCPNCGCKMESEVKNE